MMSLHRPTLKFGRKVYVIPYEKMDSIKAQNQQSKDDTADEGSRGSLKDGDDNEHTLFNALHELFPDRQEFKNSVALSYILRLNPSNAKDSQLLLYLQKEGLPSPLDKKLLYQKLDISDVPPALIGNQALREALEDLRTFKDNQLSDDQESSEDSDTEGDEDFGQILGRAWETYLAKSKAARHKRKKGHPQIKSEKRQADEDGFKATEQGSKKKLQKEPKRAVKKLKTDKKQDKKQDRKKDKKQDDNSWIQLF